MASFTTVADVRAYLGGPADAGQFGSGIIGSNIVVASAALERLTGRQFEVQSNTKVFTTRGRASLTIPDLISASLVTLNSATLTANSSYYLIPDSQNSGVFTAIDLPQYRVPWDYRGYADWFDKNYDSPLYQQRLRSGIPNDLSITGIWGWPSVPVEAILATRVLAAWYTKRPDAVLSNVIVTPDGNTIGLSTGFPPEVEQFIRAWSIPLDAVVTL